MKVQHLRRRRVKRRVWRRKTSIMKGTQTMSMVKVKVQFSGEILNSEMPQMP
jgi:hypothetical protein